MEPVSIKRRRTELDHSHESQKFTVKIEPSLPQPINNGFIKIEPLFNEVKNTGDLVIKLEPQSLGYGDNEIASSVLDNTNDRIVKTEFDDEIYGISEDLNIRKDDVTQSTEDIQIKEEEQEMLSEMYILNQHGDTDAPNVEKNEQYVDFVEQSDDLDSVKKSKRYMCSVCFKLFSKEKELKSHIKKIHKLHCCVGCGKNFHARSNMQTHSKTCGSQSNYKTGKQKDMSHSKRRRGGQPFILNVHFTCKYQDTIPTYVCMMCDEKFSERHDLNSHIYNLHYPYSCTICGEIFNKERALIEHSRSCTFILCRKNKPEHLNEKTTENPAIGKDNMSASSSNIVQYIYTTVSVGMQSTNTNPISTRNTNPITGNSNPVTGNTNPVTGNSNPVTGNTNPVTGNSNPVTGNINPVMGNSNPVTGSSNPVTGNWNPVTGNSNPVTGNSNPVTGNSNPITGNSNPVTGNSNPITGNSNPVTGNSNPITGNSNAVTGNINPVSTQNRNTKPTLTQTLNTKSVKIHNLHCCVGCGKIFHARGNMKTHSKTCGSLSNYKTGKQKDMSHSKRRRGGQPFILNVHFTCKYQDTIPTYVCMMCDEKFSERHDLNSHIYNLHYPYSCTICGEIFNKERALIEHSRSCTFILCRKNKPEHLNEKTTENPAIGKDNMSASSSNIVQYIYTTVSVGVQSTNTNPISTRNTNPITGNSNTVTGNTNPVTGNSNPVSTQSRNTKPTLTQTLNTKSVKIHKLHTCFRCGVKFQTRVKLQTHSKTCRSLSNYKMGKQKDMSHSKRRRSGQPFILNVHFTCKYCDTIPTYGCMMCDEKFSERHNLNSHIYNLHYPYSCTICGEIFNKERALIEHSRSCTFILCRKNKPEHLNEKTTENPAIGKDNMSASSSNIVQYIYTTVSVGMQSKNTNPISTRNTNPITGNSNPVTGNTNPVTGNSNPVTGNTNPVTGNSNPVTGNINPVMGNSNPVTGSSNPVTGNWNPVTGNSNPVTGNWNPVTGNSNPVTGNSNPITGNSNPVTGNINPVSTQNRNTKPTLTQTLNTKSVKIHNLHCCVGCGKIFHARGNMKTHSKTCGSLSNYKTGKQKDMSHSKRRRGQPFILNVHFTCKYQDTIPTYVCMMCDEKFSERHNLNSHIYNLHYPYSCTICGEIFNKERELIEHSRSCTFILYRKNKPEHLNQKTTENTDIVKDNISVSSSNPITGNSNPVTGNSNPVTGNSNPVTGNSNPVMGNSNPVMGNSNPVTGSSNPETGNSNPVTENSNPITGNSNPVTGNSNPVTGNSNPITGNSNPVTGNSNPVTGNSNPVTGNSNPVTGNSNPVTGNSNPVTGSSNPEMGNSNPVMGISNPVTGNSHPVTGNSNLVTGNSNPVTGNSNLVTGNSNPVTGNSNPVTGNSNPVTGNSNPVTGNSNPVTGNSNPVSTQHRNAKPTLTQNLNTNPVSTQTLNTKSVSTQHLSTKKRRRRGYAYDSLIENVHFVNVLMEGLCCYMCTKCNEKFSRKCDMNMHIVTHFPYSCSICGKMFSEKKDYLEHSRNCSYVKL